MPERREISWKVSRGIKSKPWGARRLESLGFSHREANQYLENRNDYLRLCIAQDVSKRNHRSHGLECAIGLKE